MHRIDRSVAAVLAGTVKAQVEYCPFIVASLIRAMSPETRAGGQFGWGATSLKR